MTATFHGPNQRHQYQVEEDRQREKRESPVSVPGQQEGKEEEEFRRRSQLRPAESFIYLLLLCENSARQHLVTTAVVDRIKAGTLDMDYFCLGCPVGIMDPRMEHPLFFGSLCNRECKVI